MHWRFPTYCCQPCTGGNMSAMRCRFASNDARVCAGQLVLSATEQGTLSDRKWALEVVGIVPEPILLRLLQKAFASPSQWLKEVAYRQGGRLPTAPRGPAHRRPPQPRAGR